MVDIYVVSVRPGRDPGGRGTVRVEYRVDAPDADVFHVEVIAADEAGADKTLRGIGRALARW